MKGKTLIDAIDVMQPRARTSAKPLRLPIHKVHEIAGVGTVAVGCVQAGTLSIGMSITLAPSGVTAEVVSIEKHHWEAEKAREREIVSFSIGDNGPVSRGDVASDSDNDPATSCKSFEVRLIARGPINNGDTFTVYCHTAHAECTLETIRSMDRRTDEIIEDQPSVVHPGHAAVVKMTPINPICVERHSDYEDLGHVVIRSSGKTFGFGTVVGVEKN